MFSSRLPSVLTDNALTRAAATAAAGGSPLLDLTETNPTAVGLAYPSDLPAALTDPGLAAYHPEPLGLPSARAAVAAACAVGGRAIGADRVVLTASTSEAYALLFKLLADPGDNVLVPQPGYPLFDLLTRLEAVAAVPYQLDPHGGWTIDRASVERALTPRSRAILVVSPNNPIGVRLTAADRDWLVEIAVARGLAVIADEVFDDYRLSPRPGAVSLLAEDRALTFTLGGLSKSAGLPQMKLAWIVVSGPPALVDDALARLTVIADTYLSVSTPVQLAAGPLLNAGLDLQRQALAGPPLRRSRAVGLVAPHGGWSAVMQVPAIQSEEALALRLIEEAGVRVHPGYFFDFPREAFLVVSLLPAPEIFDEAVRRAMPVIAGAPPQ